MRISIGGVHSYQMRLIRLYTFVFTGCLLFILCIHFGILVCAQDCRSFFSLQILSLRNFSLRHRKRLDWKNKKKREDHETTEKSWQREKKLYVYHFHDQGDLKPEYERTLYRHKNQKSLSRVSVLVWLLCCVFSSVILSLFYREWIYVVDFDEGKKDPSKCVCIVPLVETEPKCKRFYYTLPFDASYPLRVLWFYL